MHDPGGKLLRFAARVPPGPRGWVALAASIGAHVLAVVGVHATGALSPGRPALPVALVPLPGAAWSANRLPSPAPPPAFIRLPPDVERDPLRALVPPPPSARHLAARPQTVAEERVSRDAGAVDGEVLRVAQRAFAGAEGSGERGEAMFSKRGRGGARGAGGPRAAPAPAASPGADEAIPGAAAGPDDAAAGPPPEAALPAPGGEGGERIVGERIPGSPVRELPRPEGGPNFDGHGEVPEGDETRLDAREDGSAPFWIAVRDLIEDEWQRRAAETFRRLDPLEEIYFWKNRTAVLKLALDAAGALRDVEVLQSSSLEFFDDVAVEAIRASTYPSPPPEALASNGEARIQVRITWVPSTRPKALR